MNLIFPFKKRVVFLTLLSMITFFGCQKELSEQNAGTTTVVGTPADLSTKVTASMISGFVTDENNLPVLNAPVKSGIAVTSTDKYGYFEFKNIEVIKNAAFVTVTVPGYFKGIKTFVATAGKGAFFRIKLIPKINAGSVDATTGGKVTLSNNLSVSLPANAIVNAGTGATYSGSVKIAAYWINPDATDLNDIMPGDLRGINTAGAIKMLQTYGMSAVELTGASGELLQIASGKKATLTFPLPASLAATAPASIPLWYFDETNGLWKEDGAATKTGNTYVGDVSHFSYWNCDIPFSNAVQFDLTVVDVAGNPVQNANVQFSYSNGGYTGCHGITDSAGHVSGSIPANASLILQVFSYQVCPNTPVYTQAVTTTNVNISLGTITLSATSSYVAEISGIVLDCNGLPVTNGYVMLQLGYINIRGNTNSSGVFHINTIICGNNSVATIFAIDLTTLQQSTTTSINLVNGQNNLGNITACGTSALAFINYTLNGTPVAITFPTGTIYQLPDSTQFPALRMGGYEALTNNIVNSASMTISNQNIAPGSIQDLLKFESAQTGSTTIPTPIAVNITEYGSIGQYIAGNYIGTVVGAALPNTSYTLSCSFRVKRSY
ncbi:MAG: Ig-like domain-containing protein [Ferruginibacter sp.]